MNHFNRFPDDSSLDAAYRAAYLIAAYLQQQLTPAEQEELDAWIEARPENLALFEDLVAGNKNKDTLKWFQQLDKEKAKRRLHRKLLPPQPPLFRWWLPYAAAACLLAGAGAWWYLEQNGSLAPTVAERKPDSIYRGNKAAILTLADGRQILLDTAADGTVALDGSATINKTAGFLRYSGNGNPDSSGTRGNTITVPKGSQFHLRLSDGTEVWLNSASVLHYPAFFSGPERRVRLQGEGYFEVVKNKSMPFHVEAAGADVLVLGTHFNVQAYGEGAALQTTLLEGRVQVGRKGQAVQLRPGEQAQVFTAGTSAIRVVDNTDVDRIMGWKNGLFIFRNDSLPVILKELERWYDITVSGSSHSTHHYTGTFKRSLPLAKILQYLQEAGDARFKVDGGHVTVLPSGTRP